MFTREDPGQVPAQTIHAITRSHDQCQQCGLPLLTCLCDKLRPIATRARFVLLTSPKETLRASNTGRLLKLVNPHSTDIVVWARRQPDQAFLQRLLAHPNPYLVFPHQSDDRAARPVSRVNGFDPLFVLLDGTWQEARKIARKSAYLDALPRLSLPGELHSGYRLRERQKPGALCTIEAAVECLKLAAEPAFAEYLKQSFELFLQHYQAGLSGHAVKDG